ncbi:MAG: TIGR04086 family membrane protein [Clostridia bacterium]|nr:TIGR04086 family membrane protein [Clostridia bacterium]
MENSFVKNYLLPVVKGVLVSVFVSVVIILIFALVIKFLPVSSVAVKIVNQLIKVVSIFIGCKLFISDKGGIVKGLILGLLYVVLVNLTFSLISGNYVSINFVNLLFGGILGAISGIISVNSNAKN